MCSSDLVWARQNVIIEKIRPSQFSVVLPRSMSLGERRERGFCPMAEEKFHFQSEASELLRMMIHSVYSNRDIFLRELISNASDALDKRRIESLFNSDDAGFTSEIRIARDRETHTLTVSNNNIGITCWQ